MSEEFWLRLFSRKMIDNLPAGIALGFEPDNNRNDEPFGFEFGAFRSEFKPVAFEGHEGINNEQENGASKIMNEPIHVISLGAGVQSSCLALMAARGEITPMPTAAIFADTQGEPQDVYDYLAYLTPLLPFPCHTVTQGNLEADFLEALKDPSVRCGQPPFYVWNEAKQMEATLWRQCTKEYKLDPIRRKTRELCNGSNAVQWIGISLDEAHRMKPSGVKYIENRYPLIDLRMSRHDCLRWLAKHGYGTPPKSACRFCPYINNQRLREMRDKKPEEWRKLVAFDKAMRTAQKATVNGAKITGTIYVHRSCKPIDEVDMSTDADRGQIDLFGNECEGMCGV